MLDQMCRLCRKRVEVVANGISYTGLFLGADDEYLYMIGPASYLTIPMEAVAAVREEGGGEGAWLRREIEGAPPPKRARNKSGETEAPPDPGEDERDAKRRYGHDAYQKFFTMAAPENWPESGGPPASDPEPDSGPDSEESA
jgi:hypothetical protein